jgi:hypothetical protein
MNLVLHNRCGRYQNLQYHEVYDAASLRYVHCHYCNYSYFLDEWTAIIVEETKPLDDALYEAKSEIPFLS